MHVRTCNLVRHICREIKSKIELKYSYIYDFDPKAMLSNAGLVQNRSDFEQAYALALVVQLNEDFLWWIS